MPSIVEQTIMILGKWGCSKLCIFQDVRDGDARHSKLIEICWRNWRSITSTMSCVVSSYYQYLLVCGFRTCVHSHTMLIVKLNVYKLPVRPNKIILTCLPLPSASSACTVTLQRCSRVRLVLVTTVTLSLLSFHLILMKLPLYSTRSLKSWPPVLRSSIDEMRYIPFT